MLEAWAIAIIQNLLASAVWATGSALKRAALIDGVDIEERLGSFTAQIMDTDAITAVVEDSVPDGCSGEQLRQVLAQPDLQPFVHELLTARLLEQHNEAELLRGGMRSLVSAVGDFPSDESAETLADQLFDWLDNACSAVAQSLDGLEPAHRQSIQQLAGLSSLDATVKRIAKSVEAISACTREIRREDADYLASYRRQASRKHGAILLPDVDIERRIPLSDIYVPPVITVEDESPEVSPEQLVAEWRRVVLLGQPGGGKSTLGNVLIDSLAKAGDSIPFLVVLRKYGKDYEAGLSFVQHIERMLNVDYQQDPPPGWVERSMSSGRAVVVFDGLDELLNSSRRREIRDAVDAFCQMYPFVRVLVTSRVVGYDQAPLPGNEFLTARLGEFDEDSVKTYVEKYFGAVATGLNPTERVARIEGFLRESESVSDLRTNPLLLSLMCVLYRGLNYIPESRLNLYDECAKLLFRRWDRSRDINVSLEIGNDIEMSLMHLALWMLESGQTEEGVLESALVRECARNLVPRRYEHMEDAVRVAEEFVGFCRDRAWVLAEVGVSPSGERRYTFTHRTFLEYYAAHQIARLEGTPEAMATRILPRIAATEWDVIGQLLLLIANKSHDQGADRLLGVLIRRAGQLDGTLTSTSRVLEFASRSLQYVVPSPQLTRELVREVYLFSAHSSVGAPAGSRRGRIASPPPISLIASAPHPSRDTVADELRQLIEADMAKREHLSPAVNTRVLALASMMRVCTFGPAAGYSHSDLYDYWGAWSVDVLSDFLWLPDLYDPAVHDGAMGALEVRRIGLEDFVDKYSLPHLWRDMTLLDLRLGRSSTLGSVDGYLGGRYVAYILLPGAVDHILGALPSLLRSAELPVSIGGTDRFLQPRSDASRYDTLNDASVPGALLLRCMAEEKRHYHAWERGRLDQLSDPMDDWESTPFPLHPIDALVFALAVRRSKEGVSELDIPEKARPLWQSLEGWVRTMLERWSTQDVSFWTDEVEENEPSH